MVDWNKEISFGRKQDAEPTELEALEEETQLGPSPSRGPLLEPEPEPSSPSP